MELYRMNNQYIIEDLIEGYTSLIWTERLSKYGEFQLKTANIVEMQLMLPIGTFVTHKDTKEVMRVENHTLTRNAEGRYELTVSGRSFISYLLGRPTYPITDGPNGMDPAPNEDPIVNFTPTAIGFLYVSREMNPLPNVNVTTNIAAGFPIGDPTDYLTPINNVYDEVVKLISPHYVGLRSIRGVPTEGEITVELYSGKDRTETQTTNPAVIFREDLGHFSDISYVDSIQEYYSEAHVYSDVLWLKVYEPGVTVPTAYDRRGLVVSASEVGMDYDGDALSAIRQKGLNELAERRRLKIFDAKLAPVVPYIYKEHYDLGDIITLKGDWGLSNKMRVVENVQTEDQNGEGSNPSLELVDD